MANTLNLGNGNWATKEDSLLAYNSENNNYKPLPFSFSRESSATRVNKDGLIETVGSGQARIDYKDNSKGALLLEPTRSNYILKSDDVLSTYQSQNGDVSDASEPINGFNNSIQIEYDASNSLVYKRDFTPTIGTEYTIYLFVQMNDNSEPIHTVDANSGDFSLINNNSVASASDIKTERLGSTNVYRVSSTRTATSINNRFGIIKYSTQSSKGFKVTGFQLEVGYPTSYIPTQGGVETRLAESCSQTVPSNIFNSVEGVIYTEISSLSNDGTQRRFTFGDANFSNNIRFTYMSTDNVFEVNLYNGSDQGKLSFTLTNATKLNKIAYLYSANDFQLWINGVKVGFVNSGTTFSSGTIVRIAQGDSSSQRKFYGNIKDLKVYNEKLTEQQLQALTTI